MAFGVCATAAVASNAEPINATVICFEIISVPPSVLKNQWREHTNPAVVPEKTPIVWVPRSDETAQGFKIAASHARYVRIHPSSTRARADKDEKIIRGYQRLGTAAVPSEMRENTHHDSAKGRTIVVRP
ncbi:MAG: hypothetical protein ABIO35_11545 [Nitrobacter sp.]